MPHKAQHHEVHEGCRAWLLGDALRDHRSRVVDVHEPVHLLHNLVLGPQALVNKALVHKALIKKAQLRLPVRGNMATRDKGSSASLLGIGALGGRAPLKRETLRKQTCERMGKEVTM